MEDPQEYTSKNTWKTFFLVAVTVAVLVALFYVGCVIAFVPLLDAKFTLFTTAHTYQWIFPIFGIPIALFALYLINSALERDVKVWIIQIVGWLYSFALIGIIVSASLEWANHCLSTSSDIYAYCYDGTGLTLQWKLVFFVLVAHLVAHAVMMLLAWYTVKKRYVVFENEKVKTGPGPVETKMSAGKAYVAMNERPSLF